MRILTRRALFLIFLFASPVEAYQAKEGNVSAILGPIVYKTNFQASSTSAKAPVYVGPYLAVIGDIHDRGSLEISMMYMNKVYFRERSGRYLAEKTQLMHITMGYRHWFAPSLSGSLTVFSGYSMGDIETVQNDFPAILRPDTSASDKTEYGADIAMQVEVWKKGRYAVELDTRYSRSYTAKEGEDADHIGVMLGVRYFIQAKKKVEGPAP